MKHKANGRIAPGAKERTSSLGVIKRRINGSGMLSDKAKATTVTPSK
jgi:hypothetical protein